jgi:hypothetical protein
MSVKRIFQLTKELVSIIEEFVIVSFKIGLLIFLVNCYNLRIMFNSEVYNPSQCEVQIKQLEEKVYTLQEK